MSPRFIAKVTVYDHESYVDDGFDCWMDIDQTWYFDGNGDVTRTTHDPDRICEYDEQPLSAEQVQALRTLSTQLPDDKHFLPRFQQYLFIQTRVDGREVDRVYDLIDIPDAAAKLCLAAHIDTVVTSWAEQARSIRKLVAGAR